MGFGIKSFSKILLHKLTSNFRSKFTLRLPKGEYAEFKAFVKGKFGVHLPNESKNDKIKTQNLSFCGKINKIYQKKKKNGNSK